VAQDPGSAGPRHARREGDRHVAGRDNQSPGEEDIVINNKIGAVTSRRYSVLREQAIDAVQTMTDCQFRLGDIALEIEPMLPVGGNHGEHVYATLTQFAQEVGIEFPTLLTYRNVASRWPKQRRRRTVCFTVHRELAHLDNRFDLIRTPPWYEPTQDRRWTVDAATRAAGHTSPHPQTVQEKVSRIHDLAEDDQVAVEVTSDLLRRPEVRHRVMNEPTTRYLVNRTQLERAEQTRETVRDRTPVVRRMQQSMEIIELHGACAAFVAAINRIMPALHDVTIGPSQVAAVHDNLRRVHAAADWAQTVVDTGDVSMDDQLAQLLRGDSQ
jgi:Family of unknown function (DUF6192)